jgi:cytochrome c biogenesis protein CcmG/thiol:disulfide interchange protein DsbE
LIWKRAVVLVAVALPLLALLAYGFTRDAKDIPSPLIGGKAPLFTLPLFESGSISLESLRGKVVFLNFWASWCAPCRAEARTLEAAWLKYRDRDVVFVGVDIQDKEEDAREFLREFGITYPNARDASGQAAIEYGVWGIPETFVIDRDGRITYKHVGALGWATITARLDDALRGVVTASEGRGDYRATR